MRVIGLMSGTSHDAVDAAAADLTLQDDSLLLTPLGMVSDPYPAELRNALTAALPPAATTMKDVCLLDTRIGQVFAALAARADRELCDGRAGLVASHGQTVYHWAEQGRVHGTLQIGSPAWIAEATGCPVVSDLRSRDVAAGGQGAPLVSIVDVMWLHGRPSRPAALNLGGIANLTVAAGTGDPVAFDTGPGQRPRRRGGARPHQRPAGLRPGRGAGRARQHRRRPAAAAPRRAVLRETAAHDDRQGVVPLALETFLSSLDSQGALHDVEAGSEGMRSWSATSTPVAKGHSARRTPRSSAVRRHVRGR